MTVIVVVVGVMAERKEEKPRGEKMRGEKPRGEKPLISY